MNYSFPYHMLDDIQYMEQRMREVEESPIVLCRTTLCGHVYDAMTTRTIKSKLENELEK